MPFPRAARRVPALLALAAAPLAAQQAPAAGDAVPRDLVLALLRGAGAGTPQLRVGEPAAELPATVLPPDGLVLGSVSYRSHSVTVVVMPQPPREALAAVEARATAAGWTRAPVRGADRFGGGMERGFLNSRRLALVEPTGFCHGDAYLTPMATAGTDDRTVLRLQLTRPQGTGGYSVCNPPEDDGGSLFGAADSLAPALEPPPGTEVRSTGASGSGDSRQMSAEIVSSLDVRELLRHYGEQMRAAGWEPRGAAEDSMVGVQLWQRRGARDQLWQATLMMVQRSAGSGGASGERVHTGHLRLEQDRRR